MVTEYFLIQYKKFDDYVQGGKSGLSLYFFDFILEFRDAVPLLPYLQLLKQT